MSARAPSCWPSPPDVDAGRGTEADPWPHQSHRPPVETLAAATGHDEERALPMLEALRAASSGRYALATSGPALPLKLLRLRRVPTACHSPHALLDQLLQEELRNGTSQASCSAPAMTAVPARVAGARERDRVRARPSTATQALQAPASRRGGPSSGRTTYASCRSTSRVRISRSLAAAGSIRAAARSSLEGVSYYLPEAAVASVLRSSPRARRGSAIAFDYAVRSFVAGDHSTYGGKQVALAGGDRRALLFGLDAEETKGFLEGHRLVLEFDLGPRSSSRPTCAPARGGTLGATLGHALVPGCPELSPRQRGTRLTDPRERITGRAVGKDARR